MPGHHPGESGTASPLLRVPPSALSGPLNCHPDPRDLSQGPWEGDAGIPHKSGETPGQGLAPLPVGFSGMPGAPDPPKLPTLFQGGVPAPGSCGPRPWFWHFPRPVGRQSGAGRGRLLTSATELEPSTARVTFWGDAAPAWVPCGPTGAPTGTCRVWCWEPWQKRRQQSSFYPRPSQEIPTGTCVRKNRASVGLFPP